ncbi:interleukin-10 receptor subunit beta-like [Brachionichthys hirsutus]|uniref:interleukin-10 receptor subunit beta-like n=1 Tax=Brachionichthys hirsutus TaxID=412623 RepID=UPI0036043B4B
MSASVPAFVLTLSALCGSAAALGGPANVRLTSYNMDLVLRWDPPEGAAGGATGDLVYTTRLGDSPPPHRVGCVNTSSLHCDFTRLGIFVSEYGKYEGSVHALSGAERSDWVASAQIALDLDTVIGPPNVTLYSSGASIEVGVRNPAFSISELKEVYGSVTYNITYWQDGQRDKARSFGVQQNRVVLSDLDVWTKYCVQVQVETWNPTPSEPSRTVCETTGDRERAPWVAAVVAFIVLAVAASLVAVAVVYRKRISHFLCPKDTLPQHLKQYLLAPPDSSTRLVGWNSQPPEEIYHQVSVTADRRLVEEGRPLEAAAACNRSQQPDVTGGGAIVVEEKTSDEEEPECSLQGLQ